MSTVGVEAHSGDVNYLSKFKTCETCGKMEEVCFKCRAVHPSFTLTPGFGSLNARENVRLCDTCYRLLQREVFLYLGIPSPIDGNGAFVDGY